MSSFSTTRRLLGGCVTTIALALAVSSDAQAYNPFGRGDRDSTALINARKAQGPLTTAELAVILLADPPLSAISRKTIVMGYDPARYLFRPDLSGLLCEFAVGASCPPPNAVYGSMLVSSLPVVPELQFGTPHPNASLMVEDDAVNGIVSVSFETDAPLQFETAGDRNWFAFHFEARTPYNPYETIVTFHDQPGNYDFTQLSASCGLGAVQMECGSDVPGFGVSLAPVPEPAQMAMWLAGLAGIATWLSPRPGTASRRRRAGSAA